ncbi:MAG: YhcH/YjgK/YiaL family protein [Thermoguttaceae bacterium]
MILDRLENAAMYRSLNPQIEAALAYLAKTNFQSVAPGRYELDGDRLYAMVQRYATKPHAGARWEAHRRYLDVQCVVEGTERIGWAPLEKKTEVETPYDAEKDVIFYRTTGDLLQVPAGMFAVFAPHDIHSPGLHASPTEPVDVLKVVVKVAWTGAL